MLESRLIADYDGPMDLIDKDTDGDELAALLIFLKKLRSSLFIDQLVLAAGPDMAQIVKRAEAAILGTFEEDVFAVEPNALIGALMKKAEALSTLVNLANEAGYSFVSNPPSVYDRDRVNVVPSELLMQLLTRAGDAEIVAKAKTRATDWRSSGT